MRSNHYYNIDDDINKYPGAWALIIIGGRNTGKTYSCLKSCVTNKRSFVFLKRTNEDVELLTSGMGKIGQKSNDYGIDLSPFKSINRDMFTDIRARGIKKGLGGFWQHEDDSPVGSPIGYLLSLSSVTRFKGFDLSDTDWVIFDEFQPQPWDRVNKREGEQLLDLYKTISRDKEHKGHNPLKLICLANATEISNPITNTLEITDTIADMQIKGQEYYYDSERGILIHLVKNSTEFDSIEQSSAIYKAMCNTSWGQVAFNNQFGYNDLTNVSHRSIKGYHPVVTFVHKNTPFYVYQKEEKYYVCTIKHMSPNVYNLNRENEQKKFYFDYALDLRMETINGNVVYEKYTAYDVIINYRKFYKV